MKVILVRKEKNGKRKKWDKKKARNESEENKVYY